MSDKTVQVCTRDQSAALGQSRWESILSDKELCLKIIHLCRLGWSKHYMYFRFFSLPWTTRVTFWTFNGSLMPHILLNSSERSKPSDTSVNISFEKVLYLCAKVPIPVYATLTMVLHGNVCDQQMSSLILTWSIWALFKIFASGC